MTASVALAQLSKAFGDRRVLQRIDLAIEPNQFVAVIGPSGVGKSTLLRIVAGLEAPTAGRVQVSRPDGGRADVRMMFQEDRLLPWRTVLGNVMLGYRGGTRLPLEVLDAVGLSGREHDYPLVLSGGQRQRVALARALVHRPDLLVLDEPFGALDAITRVSMQELLLDTLRREPRTSLLVTHDVEEALVLSDRVVVLGERGIERDIPVDLPIPRHRGDARIAAWKEELLADLLAQSR